MQAIGLIRGRRNSAVKAPRAAAITVMICGVLGLVVPSGKSLAGVRTEANTRSVSFDPSTYTISDASLWGPNGPGTLNVDWALSQSQWDAIFGEPPAARLAVGGIEKVCVFKCARFGAAAGLEFSAYALPYLSAEVQPGTFDASVSFAPSVNRYQFEGLGVDFFQLDTDAGIGSNNAFNVYAPSIKLDTGIDVNASLDLFARACFVGCFLDETLNLLEENFRLPLLQVDTLASSALVFTPPTRREKAIPAIRELIADPPSNIQDALNNNPGLYTDVGVLLGAQVDETLIDYEERLRDSGNDARADRVKDARDAIKASPVTVDLSNPFTNNAQGQWAVDQTTAEASIGGDLLDLRLDVDQVVGTAFGLPSGGSASLDDFNLGNPVIDASVTLVDLQVGPSVDLKTNLELRPELMVEFQFTRGTGENAAPAEVIIAGQIGRQTSYRGSWEDLPEIALIADPGTTADGLFGLSSEPIFATPTFFVESTLSNRTYLDITAGLVLTGPSARIEIIDFDALSINPLPTLTVETPSIAQIDIFNRTFSNTGWTSTGSTTGEALSFVAAGEILFQARSVGDRNIDAAFNAGVKDDRIDQHLTVDVLLAGEIDRRGYDYTPLADNFDIRTAVDILASQFGDISRPGPLFLFEDDDVEAAVRGGFTIDASQTAQVMTDGSLTVANPADRLVIEADGALELAAKHPYGTVGGDASGSATTQYGLTNLGAVDIHGDVYMGTGGVAVEDYVYRNGTEASADSGTTTIGPTGRVKLDGRLENSEGSVIDNYGRLELTGNSSRSQGQLINRYLAEADIYGGLELEADARLVQLGPDRQLLDNTGTFTLHGGAQVNASSKGFQTVGEINNNGQLILRQDSELTLASDATSGGSLTLNNHFLIDNAGTLQNLGGANAADSRIVNGKPGHDWSMFRNATDIVETLLDDRIERVGDGAGFVRQEPILPVGPGVLPASSRQNQIASSGPVSPVPGSKPVAPVIPPIDLTASYAAVNGEARLAANIAAGARQVFLSEMMSYINDSRAVLEWLIDDFTTSPLIITTSQQSSGKPLVSFDADEGITRAILLRLKTEYQSLRSDAFTDSPAFDLRSAEANYGNALRSLGDKRDQAMAIYAQINAQLQQQAATGVGVIVNRGTGVLENRGLVTNHSVLLNETGGQVYNTESAELNNSGGYVRNNGLLANAGTFVNTVGAAIDNGLKTVRDAMGVLGLAELVNLGNFANEGEVVNNDTLVNYGTLTNGTASADADPGAQIVNNGVMANVGNLSNNATLSNAQGAEFANHSTLVNDGMLVNDGVFNNGQTGIGPRVDLAEFVTNANNFYDRQRRLVGINNLIRRYDEQIRDSEAREALIELNLIPVSDGDGFFDNGAAKARNALILAEYNQKVAAAQAETDALRQQRGVALLTRQAAEQSIRNINAVDREMLQDESGNTIAGDLFLNLARLASTNTAELENNGTFINRGIFNNVATVANNAGGRLENNGILMVSEEGVIDNRGTLLISETSANGFSQSGMLVSNGTINNTGQSARLEISSGVLVNGTVNENATLNNTQGATIALTASAGNGTSALLINDGQLINGPFGSRIEIGTGPVEAAREGLGSANTLVNTGTIKNQAFARILNYGELINAGTIENAQWATFISDGTLHNTKSGVISFADAAALNGFTVNDGLITMTDGELLTLTGDISGSGTFAGNVLIQGDAQRDENGDFTTSVNPGNSPGLLTFNGDVWSQNVDWIMEIWGTERGVTYDGVDINGDFKIEDGFGLTLLSWLDVDAMLNQTFTFFTVAGDLLDAAGHMIARSSFDFLNFSSDQMSDNWAGSWDWDDDSGWRLNLSFVGMAEAGRALYAQLPAINLQARLQGASTVPAPASIFLMLAGVAGLIFRQRLSASSPTKGRTAAAEAA